MKLFLISLLSFAAVTVPALADQDVLVAPEPPVRTAEKWSWKNCDQGTSSFVDITKIAVSPDPPKPGENLTVHAEALVNQVIEEGAYADVTVKLGLIKLLSKTFDLCEEARNANTTVQCPVAPGQHVLEHTVALPKEIPKAKFVINVKAYTVDDEDLACLELVVDFMKKPFFTVPGW